METRTKKRIQSKGSDVSYSLNMADTAAIGNFLLSFMSDWIVGNVEAPE